MRKMIIVILLCCFISPALNAGGVTPEVYGIKFNEVFLCKNASCSEGVKIGGGQRMNIADPFFTNHIGTLIDLKGANLGSTSYTHIKFNVDTKFIVKAKTGGCYSFPTKVEPGFSEGTSDQSLYGEQLIQLDPEDIECSGCSNVTSDSFDYTQALSGTYKKGTGQSIVWNIDATDSVYFEGCTIGPDKPGLDFQVIQ